MIEACTNPPYQMRATGSRRLYLAGFMLLLALLSWLGSPVRAATITVTTTDDEVNTDGDCSLREAIIAANTDTAVDGCGAGSGADTISLPAGTYLLTIAGSGENAAMTGDLDITAGLSLVGSGPANTIIDGNGLDRVFASLSGQSSITAVTIQGGDLTSLPGGGAGILVQQGSLTLTRSRIRNNTGDAGLNVQISGASLAVQNSRIENNSGRGLLLGQGTTTTVMNSVISGNSTSGGGGGIHNGGTLTLVNSTLSGNGANSDGGGLFNLGTTNLYNVTVANNTADVDGGGALDGDGGGVYQSSGTISIRNSIIADNSDSSPSGDVWPDCGGTLTSQGYNLVEDMTGCTISGDTSGNLTGVDPNLGPLQNNDGPTQTHALLAGSPAIDAGNPAGCLDQDDLPLPIDQRGYARPARGFPGPTIRCDMGAFEYDSPGTPTPTQTLTPTATTSVTYTPTATASPPVTATPTTTTTTEPPPTPTATVTGDALGDYRVYLPLVQN